MEQPIGRRLELTANTPAAEVHGLPRLCASTDPDQVDDRFARADARVLAAARGIEHRRIQNALALPWTRSGPA